MKKVFLLGNLCLYLNVLFAQSDEAQKYANTITSNDLKKHLTIIAGDAMEGRETATEGQRKAADYLATQFNSIGLESPESLQNYQQFYPLFRDSIAECSLIIQGKECVYGSDYIAPVTYNFSTRLRSEKIVFLGYGISDKNYDDYKKKEVKGKIVLFFVGEPRQNGKYILSGTKEKSIWSYPGITKKLEVAKQKGAVAALVVSPSIEKFSFTTIEAGKKTDVYYPKPEPSGVNYILLSHNKAKELLGNKVFDTLLSQAKNAEALTSAIKEKKLPISFTYQKAKQQINASNIIGVVEGTDKKDEYVFLTAHYDHLGKHNGYTFYGADDDGSGTCAVLEMAEAFKKAKDEGKGPRRTVVFMTVSGEEKGLWGSAYYSNNPVFPMEKTSVDLNIDMVGRIDTERKTADSLNYVYVVGHNKISTELPLINEKVNNQYTQLTLDYKFDDPSDPERIYYRSDHYNFARKGVPVLFFYDGMLQSDYHKPTDTVDKINWDLYEKRVRMIFYTAWEMANRDAILKRDKPLTEDSDE